MGRPALDKIGENIKTQLADSVGNVLPYDLKISYHEGHNIILDCVMIKNI